MSSVATAPRSTYTEFRRTSFCTASSPPTTLRFGHSSAGGGLGGGGAGGGKGDGGGGDGGGGDGGGGDGGGGDGDGGGGGKGEGGGGRGGVGDGGGGLGGGGLGNGGGFGGGGLGGGDETHPNPETTSSPDSQRAGTAISMTRRSSPSASIIARSQKQRSTFIPRTMSQHD